MAHDIDVAVIGGGPAGSSAARLLARHGHSVTLLTRPTPRNALAESLPPSCLRLFDRMGISSAVERANFLRSHGNTVCWGADETRQERFPGNETGLQVRRDVFDETLLDLAGAAGVNVMKGATVRHVESGPEGNPRIVFSRDGSDQTIHPEWVLDCSGRAGVTARGVRTADHSRDTVALIGVWQDTSRDTEPDGYPTIIESYGDGWAWSIPISASTRYVTFMVDRDQTDLDRGGPLGVMYRGELAKTENIKALLRKAKAVSPPWACGATPYGATQYAYERCLLVGDAASFIDPLSSYGVKKALASAWIGAAVVHTCLRRAEMVGPATDLHNDRERVVYNRFRDLAARQYESVAHTEPHPFWILRRSQDPVDISTADDPDIAQLREDPDVLAAFADLRAAPAIKLEIAPQVSRVKRAGIAVDEVVMEDRLACPWTPAGIRFLRGVDLVRLTELAPHHEQVPDLLAAYNRLNPPAPLPDLLGALSVMLAKGMLLNRVEA